MLIILIICTAWAPFIRNFEGLFRYLLQIWSLIAPPVFIAVIFGLFYKKANAKGAIATLWVGSLLGAVAFAVINIDALVDVKAALPVYLQNALNVGFIITLICAAVMILVSHIKGNSTEDLAKAEAIRSSKSVEKMSDRENRIYKMFLAGLFIFWMVVLIAFSPFGLGN